MAKFSDIVGQEELKQHIRNAIETDKVSHAYIINGERNAGKEFIARLFAMALQCEKGGTEPCGECHSCKQAISRNQPDIIYVKNFASLPEQEGGKAPSNVNVSTEVGEAD